KFRQSAKEGDYAKAIEMLNAGKERYPAFTSSEANIWMATALSILFERASGRHELSNAQQYASLFAALAEEVSEWRIVSEYQYASLARLEGRLEEAQGRFNKLIEDAKRKGSDTYQQAVPYYLQLAELHLDADDPYNAFPLVMTCILSASKYHMHLLVHHAKVVLAETLLHLNDNKKAADILKGVMPTILAHGDLQLRSMTLSVYAECLLTSAIGDVGLWPSVAPRVVRMLETAIQGFQKLGNLDGEFKAETLLALYYWAASEPERCQKHAATCRGLHVRKQQRRRAPPIQNVRQKLVEKEGVLHDLLANGEE
ncbi:Anaphase-promoting complex subunit 5, partial [Rhizophlyctis rosea]